MCAHWLRRILQNLHSLSSHLVPSRDLRLGAYRGKRIGISRLAHYTFLATACVRSAACSYSQCRGCQQGWANFQSCYWSGSHSHSSADVNNSSSYSSPTDFRDNLRCLVFCRKRGWLSVFACAWKRIQDMRRLQVWWRCIDWGEVAIWSYTFWIARWRLEEQLVFPRLAWLSNIGYQMQIECQISINICYFALCFLDFLCKIVGDDYSISSSWIMPSKLNFN